MSRLRDRVAGMGRKQQPAQPARPYRAPRKGRQGTGNSSPGGAPNVSPGITSAPAGAPVAAAPVSAPQGGAGASPQAVMVMPLQQVLVQPARSQYVTVAMQDLVPIFTADGAAVPATAPGRWAQLRAAGRP